MHNFGMAIADITRACAEVGRRHALAASAPTERLYVMGGDFNIEMGAATPRARRTAACSGRASSHAPMRRFAPLARP